MVAYKLKQNLAQLSEMAHTAHKTDSAMREIEEDHESLQGKARQLAKWIREANHFVVFTGAGISTSAGIPDFRGPQGVWTLRAQGKAAKSVNTMTTIPTPSHMALLSLQEAGYLKFLVSQNTDGMHRRSGFPSNKLSELHGNTAVEYCKTCKKDYVRDFRCRRAGNKVHDHRTGRTCACGGELLDSIINFGENLPQRALSNGEKHGEKADLMVVLGSSLTVTPAADIPLSTAENGGRLVICNLQKTPLDRHAALRIHAKTDDLMKAVMAELDLEVPTWKLVRHFAIEITKSASNKMTIQFLAEEADGLPLSLFEKIEVKDCATQSKEPFMVSVPSSKKSVECIFHFRSNFGEPPMNLNLDIQKEGTKRFTMIFDPHLREWNHLTS